MTTKTNVKAGGMKQNHNEALTVRSDVKAGVKSGTGYYNHNETLKA